MAGVLVVDDDVDMRDLIAFGLRKRDLEVTKAGDPMAALALAGTTAFDAVILDWSMPGMDGGELCRRLREIPDLRDAPIVIVTAHADAAIRDEAFAAGATEHLTKPFSVRQLADLVADLVARPA